MTTLGRLPGAHVLRCTPVATLVASLSGDVLVRWPSGRIRKMSFDASVLDTIMLDADRPLVAAATPTVIVVADPQSGQRLRTLPAGEGQPTRLAALRDGLAWGDESGFLHVWWVGDAAPTRWRRHRKAIHQLDVLRLGAGERLVSGADDRYVYVTEPRSGAVTGTCHPHVDWLEGLVALASPDGRGHLLTIDRRRVATWRIGTTGDVEDCTAVELERSSAWTAWWSPEHAAPVGAIATEGGRLHLSVPWPAPQLVSPVVAMAPSTDGRRLAAACDDGRIVEISVADGNVTPMGRRTAPVIRLQSWPGGYTGLDASGTVFLVDAKVGGRD